MITIKTDIIEKVEKSPSLPGCYLWKDRNGNVLYVGKAKNLKNRLRSYLRDELPYKIKIMLKKVDDLEIIVTDTELNAYILEQNLIKTYKPPFNTLLKDDKSYPYLRIALKDPYPFIEITRRPVKDDSIYLGPYPHAQALRETLKILTKAFLIRQCKKDLKKLKQTRPCLKYQIGMCLGPCSNLVSREEYGRIIEELINFLKGKKREFIKKLEEEMYKASENLEFEKALVIRDRISALRQLLERQKVMLPEKVDLDVITGIEKEGISIVNVLFVRKGLVIGEKNHIDFSPLNENLFNSFFEIYGKEYRADKILTHKEIYELLADISNRNLGIKITLPEEEDEKLLLDFAISKTEKLFEEHLKEAGRWFILSRDLKEKLGLAKVPSRIEAYDMSNLSGTDPVGSMVVFIEGKEVKSEYRRFAIKDISRKADIYMHKEVIERRLAHREWEYPELMIIDGTIAHARIVKNVLKDMDLDIDVIAISEGTDHDRIWNEIGEILIPTDDPVFFFIQRVRDEAHRFAISYQKKKREMKFFE
ncbi:MAG: excinuclease ABC subunit UvrC [Thermosulfidibacteraceae bacterium]|jgi:excinuclease ABC subunit C